MSDLKKIELPRPPLPEQQKIATILSSVDDVIEKTRAQIEKLKDLKTGMMQELFTKGIGVDGVSHTEFKDSEMGRIPMNWDVLCLSLLTDVMESGWSPQCEGEPARSGEWAILKTTAVTWEGFNYQANKRLPENLEPRPSIQVDPNDILVTRAGPAERVGVVAFVSNIPKKIMLSDKIIRLKVKKEYDPRFLSYWLSSDFAKNYFSLRVSGLAQSQTNISQEILKSIPCVLPPFAEQLGISNSIYSVERNGGCRS